MPDWIWIGAMIVISVIAILASFGLGVLYVVNHPETDKMHADADRFKQLEKMAWRPTGCFSLMIGGDGTLANYCDHRIQQERIQRK